MPYTCAICGQPFTPINETHQTACCSKTCEQLLNQHYDELDQKHEAQEDYENNIYA